MGTIEALSEDVTSYFPVLEQWYIDRILRLSAQPVADACQLLLAASHFDVTNYGIRRALEKLVKSNDPLEAQRSNIINSFLRQIVLTRFNLAREERKRWFAYWIDERNLSGEGIVTVAYIVNLAAESQDLLTAFARKYVANWHIRHDDIRAPKSRAWAPRALTLCGHKALARSRAEDLLLAREKNGSWEGGYNITAAIAYALMYSGEVEAQELANTIRYLLRRLQIGVTADVALESTTLKAVEAV